MITADRSGEQLALSEAIRAAMLAGEYVPGQRLVEAELCERWGAGRSAVREALRLLAGDGLIELEPHRTARVRQITLDEAIEMAEVRAAVEVILARRAAANITSPEKDELREIGRRTRLAIESFDPVGYSELNELLHRRLSEIAAHQTAAAVVHGLRVQLIRFQIGLSLQPGRPIETLQEHEDLIQAVTSGDPSAAEASMRRHLEGAAEALRRVARRPVPVVAADLG